MVSAPITYYQLLHVDPSAAPEVIQAAYRTLMGRLRMHPDLGGRPELAQQLNDAYATLRDPARRLAYDLHVARMRGGLVTTRSGTNTYSIAAVAAPRSSARHHCRRACHNRAVVAQSRGHGPVTAQLLDLSAGGARLRLPAHSTPSGIIAVQCPEFAARGRVAWSRPDTCAATDSVEIGLQFEGLTLHATHFLLSTYA